MSKTEITQAELVQKVAELEAQMAFQDDTIQQLDAAMSQQQQDILFLVKTVNLLKEDWLKAKEELVQGQEVINTKPPHY